MNDEIMLRQKIAEEIMLDETEMDIYMELFYGYNLLVYLFLKRRETRKEIAEIMTAMHVICRKYLKYNSKSMLYEPESAMGYAFLEEEEYAYKDPNAAPKLKIMKDFLKMAASGKFKNRNAVYKILAKKYDRSKPLIVSYCKALTFEVSL